MGHIYIVTVYKCIQNGWRQLSKCLRVEANEKLLIPQSAISILRETKIIKNGAKNNREVI